MGEGMSGIAHSRIYAIMPPRDRIRIWGADGRALAADPRAGGDAITRCSPTLSGSSIS